MAITGRGFGAAAQAYERFRFGYPQEVADRVLAYAEPPVRTAVESGAGTGKATRLFAGRGITVTAVEPDAAMLAVLTEQCQGLPVRPVVSTLEELPPQEPADLFLAAASLHWTVDAGRWDRVAALLRPGGTVASFAGPLAIVDPDLEAAVQMSTGRFTVLPPQGRRDPPAGALAWPGHELVAADAFTDVVEQVIPRRLTVTAEAYVDQLATTSGFLDLSPDRRAEGLADLRGILPDHVELDADVILHLARYLPRGTSGAPPVCP